MLNRFRWVQCQLESLVLQKTPTAIRATLDAVPTTLEQTYCNILERIPKDDWLLAKRAFRWLAFSIRALEFKELCGAVIVDEETEMIDENARLLDPEELLQICSSLMSYNQEEGTVALAHSPVWDFLTSQQIKESKVGEFYIDPDSADRTLNTEMREVPGIFGLPKWPFRFGKRSGSEMERLAFTRVCCICLADTCSTDRGDRAR